MDNPIRLLDVYAGTGIREGALTFLYRLMEERQTEPEVNISNQGLPTFEHHRAFWTRRPYRFAYLVECPDFTMAPISSVEVHEAQRRADDERVPAWIGYVSATARNEIGIVLLKSWRGHRFGHHVVRALMEKHHPNPAIPGECNGRWLANINPANERSIAMFSKLGFREIQRTYEFTNPDPETLNEEEPHGQEA